MYGPGTVHTANREPMLHQCPLRVTECWCIYIMNDTDYIALKHFHQDFGIGKLIMSSIFDYSRSLSIKDLGHKAINPGTIRFVL